MLWQNVDILCFDIESYGVFDSIQTIQMDHIMPDLSNMYEYKLNGMGQNANKPLHIPLYDNTTYQKT